jgi:hypothetical protein
MKKPKDISVEEKLSILCLAPFRIKNAEIAVKRRDWRRIRRRRRISSQWLTLFAEEPQGCDRHQGSDDQVLKMLLTIEKIWFFYVCRFCIFLHFEKSTFPFCQLNKKKYPP